MKIIDVKQKTILKAFSELGFDVISYKEHIKLQNLIGKVITLPNHKFIKNTTLNTVLTQSGIDKNQFLRRVQNGGK